MGISCQKSENNNKRGFSIKNTLKMAGNSYTPNQFGSWSMASTSRTYTSTTMSSTMATISTNTTESKNPKEKSTSEVSCQSLKITETSRNSNIYIPSEYAIGARSPSVNTVLPQNLQIQRMIEVSSNCL